MARNFYFGADATMVSGSATFARGISVDPPSLGLSMAQCEAYAAVDAELQSAYLAAITPSTRTPVAVTRKNTAVKAMQRSAVLLAKIISATPTVNDVQLMALGLLPRPTRARRNLPSDPPAVQVLSVRGRVVDIRICERDSQSRRSKPFAARGADLFSYVGEESAPDSSAYHYNGFTSKTTMRVTFPNDVPSGATVWLSARWVSARGETSTGSTPIRFTLQGGLVTVAATGIELAKIAA